MQFEIIPTAFPMPLASCPPGVFYFEGSFGFKTEYRTDNQIEAFCLSSGEVFWGGVNSREQRNALIVTPCKTECLPNEE